MEPWLIGKVLSPFFALLLVWLIARPIRQALEARMSPGLIKRFLFADMDLHPWKYGSMLVGLWFALVIIAFAAGLISPR